MNKPLILVIGAVAGFSLLVWLGTKINPKPFEPFAEGSQELGTFPIPDDLPAPVEKFYRVVYGEEIPEIRSFILTGRGSLRFQGVTLPARLRFTHDAGTDYRHYIETTLWGVPILKVNEHFIDGKSRLELPFGVVEDEPQVDEAANLGLWSETMMFPGVYLTTQGVRWEAVDDDTARLVVPFEDIENTFTVQFNEESGLIEMMEVMRWKEAGDTEKVRWQAQALEWGEVNGFFMPTLFAAQWMDEASPWLLARIEDVTWNVDVSEYKLSRGE